MVTSTKNKNDTIKQSKSESSFNAIIIVILAPLGRLHGFLIAQFFLLLRCEWEFYFFTSISIFGPIFCRPFFLILVIYN